MFAERVCLLQTANATQTIQGLIHILSSRLYLLVIDQTLSSPAVVAEKVIPVAMARTACQSEIPIHDVIECERPWLVVLGLKDVVPIAGSFRVRENLPLFRLTAGNRQWAFCRVICVLACRHFCWGAFFFALLLFQLFLFLALLNERRMKRDSVEIIITTIIQNWWIIRFQRWEIAIKKNIQLPNTLPIISTALSIMFVKMRSGISGLPLTYLVYFENFHFFTFGQFLLKIAKNHKKWKFPKETKYGFLWSKMTLSGVISTKNSKNPGKSKDLFCDIISHLTSYN